MTETANSLGQPNNAEGILGLAQKLYDEHVAEGESIKNRLITDAEVEAERILSEAQAESERLRNEADEYYETTVAEANREVEEAIENSAERVNAIHENINSLQQFEARYRAGLNKLIADTQSLLESSFVSEDDENVEETVVEPTGEETELEADEEAFTRGSVEDNEVSDVVADETVEEAPVSEDEEATNDEDEDDNKRSVFVL